MAMQLVDERRLELDAPVREYLPELRLADSQAADMITTRQLLCHTSGIEDSAVEAFGSPEMSLKRFVATLGSAAQREAPGRAFSYSNAGYAIVGRLVEVLTGAPFPEAIRKRVIDPLGLQSTFCTGTVRKRLAGNVAVGHEAAEGSLPQAVAVWSEGLSPIGGVCTTIGDLMTFVRTHLNGGVSDAGRRLLSEEAVGTMQRPQVDATGLFEGDHWGLGWWLPRQGGQRVFGHYGWRSGQTCVLHAFPERAAAVAVLTNADSGIRLYEDLLHVIEPRYDPSRGT